MLWFSHVGFKLVYTIIQSDLQMSNISHKMFQQMIWATRNPQYIILIWFDFL